MGTRQVKVYDNRDDRREIKGLLTRLTPAETVGFLRWCCARATLPGRQTYPRVSKKTLNLARLAEEDSSARSRLVVETYLDVFMLANNYSFGLDEALEKLIAVVRKKEGW